MRSRIKELIENRRLQISRERADLVGRLTAIEAEMSDLDVAGRVFDRLYRKMELTNPSEESYESFKKMRWPDTDGEPVCPFCGCDAVYSFKARRVFKCKLCEKQFSVTSGTIFSNRKLPIGSYLHALMIGSSLSERGEVAQLSRDLKIDYTSAHRIFKKISEAAAILERGVCKLQTEQMFEEAKVLLDGRPKRFGRAPRPPGSKFPETEKPSN